MSLRAFHLFFIGISIVLAAFFAAWAIGEYRSAHDVTYVATGVVSLAAAVALAFYAVAFQRKTRRFS